jgi:hypothetical protein
MILYIFAATFISGVAVGAVATYKIQKKIKNIGKDSVLGKARTRITNFAKEVTDFSRD